MTLTHGFDSVIGAARLGAEWAWSELYKEIYPSLLAYFKIHEAPAPASAARALFFDLAREIHDFEGDERDFRLLVFGLAHRRLHDESEKPGGRLTRLTDRVVARLDDGSTREPLPEPIRETLAGMTHIQRDIVMLRLLGELDIDQVAGLVGIGKRQVRSIQERTSSILTLPEAVPA